MSEAKDNTPPKIYTFMFYTRIGKPRAPCCGKLKIYFIGLRHDNILNMIQLCNFTFSNISVESRSIAAYMWPHPTKTT